ncbi:hypothetical protein C823_000661 [Eubacterium plexicaudatum ASF492]|nr:hypothetical protein C823_000661 [Eubacterium plexicaudatum ASF492]
MAAKNDNKNDNNVGFNINAIKNICSKYKKYIATGAMLVLLAVVVSTSQKQETERILPNPIRNRQIQKRMIPKTNRQWK